MEIQITPDYNISYTKAGFNLITGTPALFQNLSCRLRLLTGEYLYDPTQGVDYQNLMSRNDINYFTQSIDFELKKDDRVDYSIIDTDFAEGVLSLTIQVETA